MALKINHDKYANHETPMPSGLKVLLLVILIVLSFISHIGLRTWTMAQGFELGRHQKAIAKLQSEIIALKVERNKVMGPQSLENLVKQLRQNGIHFDPPKPEQLIYLHAEK